MSRLQWIRQAAHHRFGAASVDLIVKASHMSLFLNLKNLTEGVAE